MASARLMPIALTLMRTSFGPGAGTWTSTNSRTSGPPALANLIVRDMAVSVKLSGDPPHAAPLSARRRPSLHASSDDRPLIVRRRRIFAFPVPAAAGARSPVTELPSRAALRAGRSATRSGLPVARVRHDAYEASLHSRAGSGLRWLRAYEAEIGGRMLGFRSRARKRVPSQAAHKRLHAARRLRRTRPRTLVRTSW